MNKKLLMVAAIASSLSTVSEAGPIFSTEQRVIGFNQIDGSGYGTDIVVASNNSSNDGSVASSSLSGTKVINGVDGSENQASMTISFDGEAEVSSGSVKSRMSGSIQDGFYNPDENTPFVIDKSFNTDPNGVPTSFVLMSTASYSNSFALTGDNALDYVQFSFNLDGFFTGPDGGSVQLIQTGPTWDNLFSGSLYSEGPNVDTVITSNAIKVVDGIVDLSFYLQTSVDFDFFEGLFDFEGTDFLSGAANFFNTLTFGAVSGFDEFGNAVDLTGVVDDTGFQFDTVRVQNNPSTPSTDVPGPSTLAIFAIGLLGLVSLRFKKQS